MSVLNEDAEYIMNDRKVALPCSFAIHALDAPVSHSLYWNDEDLIQLGSRENFELGRLIFFGS